MDEQLPKSNDLLYRARKEKFLTQRQLSDILNVSSDTVRSWERGRRSPTPELLEKLCSYFQKNSAELGFGSPITAIPSMESAAATEEFSSPKKSAARRANINRSRMINRVRSTWIDGVLSESLHQASLIVLGLQNKPDALENPWRLAVQETNLPPRQLPPGISIVDAYDDADGDLLILGEPGAGKTTLLLELARMLLKRTDEIAPVPVIFNLSSWAEKQLPITEWLVSELKFKYHVPLRVAQEWIQNDQLIVLLDGLDEVVETARAACVKAINLYKIHHDIVHVVVCCRAAEYFNVETHIRLQQAVLIQPLTLDQIHQYLANVGAQLEGIKKALDEDTELQEMVKSPLMLSILTITYAGEGKVGADFAFAGSPEARRKQVLSEYKKHMLMRRGEASYTQQQTDRWLTWLARQMQQRGLTEFYLERMQPDWISEGPPRDRYHRVALRFIYSIESIMIIILFAWVRGGKVGREFGVGAGLLGELGAGKGNIIFGWMARGIGGGIEAGGSLGIIFALVFSLQTILISATEFPFISWKSAWHGLRKGLKIGLITGGMVSVFCVPIFSFLGGIVHGLTYGLGMGLFGGLQLGLLSGLLSGLRYDVQVLQNRGQNQSRLERLVDGLTIGLCAGLSFALVDIALHIAVQSMIVYAFIGGFFCFCSFGFAGGSRLLLLDTIKPAEAISWSWTHIRRTFPDTLIRCLVGSLVITLCVVIVIILGSSVFYGLSYGARYGLIYGLIVGVVVSFTGVLASLLNSGWSSDMLNDNQLFRPNEGIRRSFRNATFAGILFAPVGGALSGIVCGIAFGAIGGLAGWPILSAGFALVFGLLIGFQFAMIHGGIACIEHYLLRWQLWRAGVIPMNYVAFLDYAASRILLRKVGGGYMFAHRTLLDYFASLPLSGEER